LAEAMNPTIQEENTSGLHLRALRAGRCTRPGPTQP
jgi:hypothetical protein